ncbi:hypothetical protein DXM21_23405 [Agrobacterium rosae]|nr:hypothetical protein DXM21_23405 [Agrobacterium rosae]KAA3513510.1 hypothetical protein DXM25_23600 [Agrobacterium rosae]MQB51069.1 hypothetical protein [Agrobacterium rosae]
MSLKWRADVTEHRSPTRRTVLQNLLLSTSDGSDSKIGFLFSLPCISIEKKNIFPAGHTKRIVGSL